MTASIVIAGFLLTLTAALLYVNHRVNQVFIRRQHARISAPLDLDMTALEPPTPNPDECELLDCHRTARLRYTEQYPAENPRTRRLCIQHAEVANYAALHGRIILEPLE